MNQSITAIILAAGKGTRMKSARAKVLHEVFFQPMLHHVLNAVHAAGIDRCAVIVGHQRKDVVRTLDNSSVLSVLQEAQLGTGHAVLCAEETCRQTDLVLILCGDTPLIQAATLRAIIAEHQRTRPALTLMTTRLDQPFGYGRIISNGQGMVQAIVEEKDASDRQRAIHEINAGIYLAERDFLFQALRQVGTDNSQGEVYLTDIVAIANRQGLRVEAFVHADAIDVLGVNSRIELAQAQAVLQARHNVALMLAGVTMFAPETILIAPDCAVGQDTIIEAGVRITEAATVGRDCRLAAGCVLRGCTIGNAAHIGEHAVIERCRIPAGAVIPPLTHRSGD